MNDAEYARLNKLSRLVQHCNNIERPSPSKPC